MRRAPRWLRRGSAVEISERDGVRCLHLGNVEVQSAMRLDAPWALELTYTRAMMAFLLFRERPERLLLIGLGGGSLAKFCWRQMPWAHVTAVELLPEVVAAARSMFGLPPDDERLAVETGDGAAWLAGRRGPFDAVLLDAYEGCTQAPALRTREFFTDARRALSADGVLVANFMSNDRDLDACLGRLEAVFEQRVLLLESEYRSNLIALAFPRSQGRPAWDALRARAERLQAEFGLEFPAFVEGLRKLNPGTWTRLEI